MEKQTDARVIENESKFQKAWDRYWHQETTKAGQKKQWDIMFLCVQFACENMAKSKAYGIRIVDLEGKALDATVKIMQKINEGLRPDKLSSYCYLWVIGELWSKKHRRWEESTSFDGLFDNYATVTDDDGFISICSSGYNN